MVVLVHLPMVVLVSVWAEAVEPELERERTRIIPQWHTKVKVGTTIPSAATTTMLNKETPVAVGGVVVVGAKYLANSFSRRGAAVLATVAPLITPVNDKQQ